MIDLALPSRLLRYQPRRPPRWAALLVVTALVMPGHVGATPATDDDLHARAVDLDERGPAIEAAALWEALARETDDDDLRLVAYARAVAAWERAHAASGDPRCVCAARSLVALALADERLVDEGRRELAARASALEAHAVDCSRPRVPMLVGPSRPPPTPPTPPIDGPITIDEPKRLPPQMVAGALMIAIAAPALGGFIYAAAEDRKIVRGFRRLGAQYDQTDTYDEAEAQRLKAEAPIVRGMAIGLGLTTAALTGVAVGLLVAGHRARTRSTTSLSLLPDTRGGGVVLRGRF